MKKRIYIAGKVSGEDRLECVAKFAKAQKEIEAQGFMALNPVEFIEDETTSWEHAMKICICYLMTADAVLFLPCWMDSRGAILEHKIASDLNMKKLNGTRDLTKRV